jgi:hypothetical protein
MLPGQMLQAIAFAGLQRLAFFVLKPLIPSPDADLILEDWSK